NKGMALFPRKVAGKYRMLGRQDGENIYLMDSDDLYFWHSSNLLMAPEYPWEFVQLGNCGSPIETPEGWLVLSHGVGAMRKYCIGAFLLDLEDPSRVLARLPYPLITPLEEEREGYVPNVVYTCGALLHAGKVIIPYAMSDYSTGFARVLLDDLLGALLKEGKVENNLHTSSYL
ncbi:MAG: glycosidase, partial [Siphonobacter aquaeclarae]|nr:glycosidase [Siphonobacter aquaeclarae]